MMTEGPAASLTEGVYRSLRSDILSCRIRPGSKIKIKDEAIRLEVSPSAVRESLSRLSSEGLVKAEPQRGFLAAPISQSELNDLTQVRVEVEASCIRRAVAHATLEWEGTLLDLNHRLAHTPITEDGDEARLSDEWARTHYAYHAAIVSTCDSPILLRIRNQLYQQSERYRHLSVPLGAGKRDLAAEHGEIVEALIARDADRAVALMTAHIEVTSRVLLAAEADRGALAPLAA
ncbi:MAG: GntR family transcriptional regulator [Caulobacteraceae bacterium]